MMLTYESQRINFIGAQDVKKTENISNIEKSEADTLMTSRRRQDIPWNSIINKETVIRRQLVWVFLLTLCIMLKTSFAQYQQEGAEVWNTADYFKREHSLTKPYQGSGWMIPNWDFYGSTIVTNNYIRLTPDARSQQGGLWNSVPVSMRNWEVQLQFQVHGKGKDLFGDGIVFWYSKDRMQPGPVFGSRDYFLGLAVVIDTYSNHNGPHNHQHPYISATVNNGTMHYDHDRDGTHTQLAGCEAKLRNLQHESWISIRYERDILYVSTDILGKNAWAECLKVEGVTLPTGYFFGLSAATGDLSDNHDIIAIRTYELDMGTEGTQESRDNILPAAVYAVPPREHVEDPKSTGVSGIKIFFYTLIAILGIFAIVVVGIIVYQNHQNNSRKRFY